MQEDFKIAAVLVLDKITPIIGVIIGWLLSQMASVSKAKSERKMAIARAIADLLEVHHHFRSQQRIMQEFRKWGEIPVATEVFLRDLLAKATVLPDNFSAKYNETVATIASHDPLLGFNLRSKDLVGVYFQNARSFQQQVEQQAPEGIPIFLKMNAQAFDTIISGLESTISDLGWRYSFYTWFKLKRSFSSTVVAPEISQLMEQLKSQIETAEASQPAAPQLVKE